MIKSHACENRMMLAHTWPVLGLIARRVSFLGAVASSLTLAVPALAEPAATTYLANGEVPAAVQELRRHMLDSDVNVLTFRSMDKIFETRLVPRAGPVWQFDRGETLTLPSYEFKGQTFTSEQFFDRTFTNALLVIRDGKIVSETYRNNTDASTHFISFSIAKSLTSMLVGIAVEQGSIESIEDFATKYVPELKSSGYDGVTIRQLLEMRSGVDYEERYDFGANPTPAAEVFEKTLVQNRQRFVETAPQLRRKNAPGTVFNYSTMDTAVLGWILERATGKPLAGFMSETLWQPAGMESNGFWIADGPPGVGRELNGMGYNATLRDFGRIGQMMLDEGRANGRQIVPTQWVTLSTTMKPFTPGAATGYGFQWWHRDTTGAYMAVGLQGQYIYVQPATKTVVVKLSYFPPTQNGDASEETAAYLQVLCKL
ncbi:MULTISPECIES: serine hydrolase domain-containing protein [Rhizobium/Agrobacterium group]|uniref:serine hydrolase domain-containing protein n=1 Tax=Rhizobium/Agrobacterium group TaxID=227290 RepID=UPI0017CBCCA8|nr:MULTISPECIES: serine hydrolase [Rhizobium/Agrobacterium group]MBB4403133.1 hypothetical protein [Agrobacterium radiobacter]MBB5588957.1 hypothetical protein [Agrobacterium radiobacter]